MASIEVAYFAASPSLHLITAICLFSVVYRIWMWFELMLFVFFSLCHSQTAWSWIIHQFVSRTKIFTSCNEYLVHENSCRFMINHSKFSFLIIFLIFWHFMDNINFFIIWYFNFLIFGLDELLINMVMAAPQS